MGGGENTRTAAPKKTVARASPSKGGKGGGRVYKNDDVKCSVDLGAKNRRTSDENVPSRGPARSATFQKGGGTPDQTVNSLSVSFLICIFISLLYSRLLPKMLALELAVNGWMKFFLKV